jgi:hypothetical protein
MAHREELGVAVDAGEALPHDARLPQVPLVRHQQVQRPVLVLRQRACESGMLLDPGVLTTSCRSVQHNTGMQACCHALLLPPLVTPLQALPSF